LTRALRAGVEHSVAVKIGALESDWLTAVGTPSLDEQLPRGVHRLTIVFFLPDLNLTQTQNLTLPRTGPTRECRFTFNAGEPGSRVRMLISVVYAGRAIQAAELIGDVLDNPRDAPRDARLAFRVAVPMPNPSSMGSRELFDGTLQVANTSSGGLVGVGVRTYRSGTIHIPNFGQAPITIRDLLTELTDAAGATEPLDSRKSVDFLRRLALAGGELYDVVGKQLEDGGNAPFERVQVVQSDADAFMPLEFVYDLPAPADGARLCGNWKQALQVGRCEAAELHRRNKLGDLEVVCPAGFWAVSKIIERQSVNTLPLSALQKIDPGVWSEPGSTRSRLPKLNSGLVAWSDRVNNTVKHQSDALVNALNEVTRGKAMAAATWEQWLSTIEKHRPPLLVLLSHTTDETPARLQIGAESSSGRSLSQIRPAFVKANQNDRPIVLLLGCDTANVDRQAYSFAAKFREVGASVVFGTLSSILGEHAVPVARGLINALVEARAEAAAARSGVTLGEVWRKARRKLLANGDLAALCVIAYGDAGWRF
jgi:hypothetical protein